MNIMRKIFILFLLSLTASLFAFDRQSIIHGAATSSDGEWTAISVLNDDALDLDNRESVWIYRTNAHWDFPFCLISFKSQNGWSIPSVCYDRENDSFIVYHHCWTRENNDGGFFEFPRVNGKYNPNDFFYSDAISNMGVARLLSNDCGIYIACIYGEWSGKEDRNTKIFKLKRDKNKLIPAEIDSLKNMEFAHLDWRKNKFSMDDPTFRQVIFSTSRGIIAMDANESDWYHFNCKTETLTTFSSKEEAFLYDESLSKTENSNFSIVQFILVFMILILAIFALILIFKLKHKNAMPQQIDRKEKNQFIFSIQEKERSKISRDIHDTVIQDIRVIRLEIENIKVHDESKNLQHKIEDIATDCIIKLRNICYNLAPAELVNHSEGDSSKIELVSIINSLAQQFSKKTHVPCHVGVEEGFEYPVLKREVTQNIFRVVQEALINIEKHSYATQTSIFIKNENNSIVIYITDDGIGCSQETINHSLNSNEHLGLRSMHDRIELIGGKIEFISSQDDGMEIRIEITVN